MILSQYTIYCAKLTRSIFTTATGILGKEL